MKKVGEISNWVFFLWWLGMTLQLCFLLGGCSETTSVRRYLRELESAEPPTSLPAVTLNDSDHQQVVIDNGIVRVTLSKPEGYVLGISYKGIDNVLEPNEDNNRGYWDVVWEEPGTESSFKKSKGAKFSVVVANRDQIELSFSTNWTSSTKGSSVPMNMDKRYILRRGDSGFYAYAIFERLEGMPAVEIDQIRLVFKLQQDRFKYMAISDNRQRDMPTSEDRQRGKRLAYKEAVLLTNPSNPEFKGEVDDKYQYSSENKDNSVQGWINFDSDSPVGFWIITPSNEFRNGGPIKQDLTSHVGPTALSMFVSTHYAGKEVTMAFEQGETYKKVFGPIFVYLNSASNKNNSVPASQPLWRDAVQQMTKESQNWPYDFLQSQDFIPPKQRGTVLGRLLVQDGYTQGGRFLYARSAYVGLALPGEPGSWQKESKGYQFWTRADMMGDFVLKNIVPGNYNLYAWVPGFLGDYMYKATITITPDRSAAEFHVPEPYPTLMNRLYADNNKERFRQYGLWERYTDLYQNGDLVYTIGVDNYHKHWFYAHVTRSTGNNTYESATWQIVFDLPNVAEGGNYTLQMALASATYSHLEVRFNDPSVLPAHFTTGLIGEDNAIARHGLHGLHWLFSIDVPSSRLVEGKNTIYLKQSKATDAFQGVMYDYIRLEGPSSPRT
ncbi:hypothetical protein L6164_020494 [Bauhinia variegata]|uniref:Uncharacterized protein n=1 Tax=Bauhinia variegata TaxID=167791 RepID=A0ACB9MW30_BAUVA|nr:hypothetical protein L6164_020494 [Bauhinia variegata]